MLAPWGSGVKAVHGNLGGCVHGSRTFLYGLFEKNFASNLVAIRC